MNRVNVELRDPETYQNGIYDFYIEIKHIIPAEGSIFVQLPHELQLMPGAECFELEQTFFSDQTTCDFDEE